MKQEFEMLQQEMDDIIAINKNQPPVMKFGDYISGMDTQEKVNAYWKALSDKYGFEQMSVEGSAKGNLFFLATPKPKIIPKTSEEIEMDKYDTLGKIIEQLEKCDFVTVDMNHDLKDNIAFKALKKMANE